ncbi:MAG: DNA replication/repair protein RecF [Actinomycetales bacterium]|nr:DNA replication/repair protein RecF [Actinomycetales bacterium]
MFIKHLSLSNFRNYRSAEVGFQPGVTLLLGPNGQGKTNLVEAIRYLSSLNSHRVAGYQALIRREADGAQGASALIRAMASHDERDVMLEVELNTDSQNKARVNRADVPKVRDILGYVKTVTFSPEDLDIVRRDPTERRRFIDELIVQIWPRFAGVYADYERVLKQRNSLLKSARATGTRGASLSTLDAWDASLVKYGAEIISARLDLVRRIQPHVFQAYQAIALANNEPKIIVKSSISATGFMEEDDFGLEATSGNGVQGFAELPTDRTELEDLFHVKLSEVRSKELERGLTLVGPQRDDLLLQLGNLPVKGFASHGESISYALALRLASIELLKAETRTGDPILILDDVFAELDEGRRNRLAELIASNEQVFITAADMGDVPDSLKMKRYDVTAGEVSQHE